MSLVGFVPPVPDHGSLLVDGGYVNNFPVEHAPRFGAGGVIRVNVSGGFDDVWQDYGDTLSGWWELFRWITGICWRRSHPPAPTMRDIQERLMFMSDYRKESDNESGCHLTLMPPMESEASGQLSQ